MPERFLTIIRWVLVGSAILNLLSATIGFPLARRFTLFLLKPALDQNVPVARLMANSRIQRAWAVLMATLFLALAWWLGTEAGRAALAPVAQ